VVRVALETAGFGGIIPGVVAFLASGNTQQQDVGGLMAGERGVSLRAFHHLVPVVVKIGVRHPARSDI
jgi:hypothetical protein